MVPNFHLAPKEPNALPAQFKAHLCAAGLGLIIVWIIYAGGGDSDLLTDKTFKYRNSPDPKNAYVRENIAGFHALGSPVGEVEIAFDANKMYEVVKSAKHGWETEQKYNYLGVKEVFLSPASGHQCRGFVQQAAMNGYKEDGGKIYLIPTKVRAEKLEV